MEKKLADSSNQNKQQLEWLNKKPFQRLTHNVYLKIAAAVIAIILWASVQASSDGIRDQRFVIPITYINSQYLDEKDLALKDYENTITIEVKAKASVLINMKPSHFTAIADLSTRMGDDLYRKLVQVKVKPHEDIENDITDLSYKTSEWVSITLEPMQTKTFEIEVIPEGELPEGYQLSSEGFQVHPSSIELRAPESSFSSINKIVVYVSLDKLDGESINQTIKPIVLDSNGKKVFLNDKMSVSSDSIEVKTELLKSKKIPVIVEGTSGTLAEGFQLKDTLAEPKEITILGTRADLANITSIVIPKSELNISGLTEDKEFAIDITKYLPDVVYLYGDDSVIRVTVSVEALDEKSYQISSDQIEIEGMLENMNYNILTKNITVTLRGLKEDLDALGAEEIALSVDVSQLTLGMNAKIPVQVQVRSGFAIMNTPTITMMVNEKEELPTEDILPSIPMESEEQTQSSSVIE